MYTHFHQKHSCVWLHNSWMTYRCGHQNAVKRWRPPKWRSPYGGCYKYTSCLSGTAKCFYAVTGAYVRALFMAAGRGWWGVKGRGDVPGYIRSHSTLCMSWICIRQRRACSAAMWPLCPLCFRWVGHFLMPSDRQRFASQAGFQPCATQWGTHLLCCRGTRGLAMTQIGSVFFCFFFKSHVVASVCFREERGVKFVESLLNHEKAQEKNWEFWLFFFPQNRTKPSVPFFGLLALVLGSLADCLCSPMILSEIYIDLAAWR